jgi:CMP-2-keto-3-deoxyoctulosonic acid synthetase
MDADALEEMERLEQMRPMMMNCQKVVGIQVDNEGATLDEW